MSMTGPGVGASLKAALDAARDELRADIARGAGGRGALERHSDRVDALLRQLYADAGPPEGPLIALGGYGRRHLCLHSDSDLLVLFGGRIRPSRHLSVVGAQGARRRATARHRERTWDD